MRSVPEFDPQPFSSHSEYVCDFHLSDYAVSFEQMAVAVRRGLGRSKELELELAFSRVQNCALGDCAPAHRSACGKSKSVYVVLFAPMSVQRRRVHSQTRFLGDANLLSRNRKPLPLATLTTPTDRRSQKTRHRVSYAAN
jgi:hypothetical protein